MQHTLCFARHARRLETDAGLGLADERADTVGGKGRDLPTLLWRPLPSCHDLHVSWQVERGVDAYSRKRGDHPSARVTVARAVGVPDADHLHELAHYPSRQ